MAIKEVTVTSKNQITLPVKFVNKLNLTKGRVLRVTMQGDKIILTNPAGISSKMKKYWGKRQQTVALTDDQLKQATRSVMANRVEK